MLTTLSQPSYYNIIDYISCAVLLIPMTCFVTKNFTFNFLHLFLLFPHTFPSGKFVLCIYELIHFCCSLLCVCVYMCVCVCICIHMYNKCMYMRTYV